MPRESDWGIRPDKLVDTISVRFRARRQWRESGSISPPGRGSAVDSQPLNALHGRNRMLNEESAAIRRRALDVVKNVGGSQSVNSGMAESRQWGMTRS
jgi:hypothetical protein